MIAIILSVIMLAPIFQLCPLKDIDNEYTKICKKYDNKNICILDYEYTTGTGWIVLKSTDKSIIGKTIVLSNNFDPRLLRENSQFELDYFAKYIVVIDHMSDTMIDGEIAPIIYAKEIEIIYNTTQSKYTVSDLTIYGILKSIMGVFNSSYRLSY